MNFKRLEEACKEAGITEVEVYRTVCEGSAVSTFNGEVDQNVVYEKNEMKIRGVYGGHITSLYVERDEDGEIDNIVSRLRANAGITESTDPYFIYKGSDSYPTLPEESHDYDSYTQKDRLDLCRKMEAYIKEHSAYVTTTEASVEVESHTVSIENSNGLSVSRSQNWAVVYCSGVVTKDGDTRSGYYFDFVKNLADVNYEKLFDQAVTRPLSAIGARSVASAAYPVVFENKQFASLISCFLSMFSAEAVIKKLSLLGGKVGEKVFGDNITLVDDPLLAQSPHRFTFDDEGVASFAKTVVEKGVLKTYLHNLKTAEMLGAESTGNGFGGGVRPTNLCLSGGNRSLEEMIAPIDNGIYITGMMGQHAGVNSVSGSFNLQASGYRIVHGKIADPVTLIVVSGNILDVLSHVVEIANDFESSGSVACGSVYIESLSVSGQEEK